MHIKIPFSFSLSKIAASGQCFRVRIFDDGTYRFVTGGHVLYIRQTGEKDFDVSCKKIEWREIWSPYFDLERNYEAVRKRIKKKDTFLQRACLEGAGIRILRQEHFETLISFIISQRKSIPAIQGCVEMICERFGRRLSTAEEEIYLFPTAEELAHATIDDLLACRVGYRAKYIYETARSVAQKPGILTAMESLDDEALYAALTEFSGVGVKVANCVSLFSYGRTSRVPIDTWIQKMIDTRFNGTNRFLEFRDDAGILQQYIFYYALQHKEEF